MTTLDVALTSDERTALLGPHTILRTLWVVARSSFATARINQSSFTYPTISLTVDNTSADWTSARPGMTVLVGTTAGASDIFIGRIKVAPGATTLYVGETSEGDPGLIPGGIRTAAFANNQYVTIVTARNFWSVIPLITGGNVYEDYDRTPSTYNTNPAPIVSIDINGEHNHYAVFVDSGQTYATIQFTASETLWPPSASVGYEWLVPTAFGTEVAGDPLTNTVTYEVPRSTTNYVVELVATEDSASQIQRRYINIWVGERTGTYAPIVISDMPGDGWGRDGANFTFTLNSTLLASIPDGSMVHIRDEALFNGVPIPSAVTHFNGWLVRTNRRGEAGLISAECEFIGPAGLLASRRGTSQVLQVSASPSTWQQTTADLMSMAFAQWYMLANRAWGVLELCDFNPYSTAAIGQRLPAIKVDVGSLWDQVSALAEGTMKRFAGCDPDGTIWVTPEPSLYAYGNRINIVKRDTLTESILFNYDLPRELVPKVGWLEGEAFTWDGSSTQPTPLLSLAPGYAPGQGVADQKLQSQVVENQTDINTLTGNLHVVFNADFSAGTITIQGNRGAMYKPAQGQMVRLTLSAAWSPDGLAFDRYIIITSVQRSFIRTEGGGVVVDTQLSFTVETAGVPGVTRPVPDTNSNLYGSSTAPITAPTAITGGRAARDLYNGLTKFFFIDDEGYLYKTTNFNAASPTWSRSNLSVTGTPVEFVGDAYSPRYLNSGTQVNGWLVTSSRIYRITDVFGSVSKTSVHTFGAASIYRAMDFSFGVQNWGAVGSYYEGTGTKLAYTTDGATFTEVAATSYYDSTTSLALIPGCYVSPRTPGLVYITAGTATGTGDGFAAEGYKSTTYGASPSVMTDPIIEPENWLANSIHVPYGTGDEATVYYGAAERDAGGVGPGSGTDWEVTFDFSLGDHGWYLGSDFWGAQGTTDGSGWLSQYIGGGPDLDAIGITLDFGAPVNMSEIDVHWENTYNLTGGGRKREIRVYDGASWSFVTFLSTESSGNHSDTLSVSTGISWSKMSVNISANGGGSDPGDIHIYSVTLKGPNPPPILPGSVNIRKLKKSVSTSVSDISPSISSESFGPVNQRAIHTCPVNANAVAAVVYGATSGKYALVTSTTGGAAWTTRGTPATTLKYRRVAIAGDSASVLYVYGDDGTIDYSSDFGATLSSKAGNLSSFTSPSPGNIVGIGGG